MAPDTGAEPIAQHDVREFVRTLSTWARALPRTEQALLHLLLATAAAAGEPDISPYLAGLVVPNPADVVVAATESAVGVQAGEVVRPSATAVAGRLSLAAGEGAAGSALARAVLNRWGER